MKQKQLKFAALCLGIITILIFSLCLAKYLGSEVSEKMPENGTFSFYGNQITIESLPDYVPNSNVLLSVRNLSDDDKSFYNEFAKTYQYLHSGNFDYISAFRESNSSNNFSSEVFAVFDFTPSKGKTVSDYLPIINLFYATQSEIYYLDIHEISFDSDTDTITFGMRLENMYQFTETVDDLNVAIISTNQFIEDFYLELRDMVQPDASRYDIVKIIHDELIAKVEYDVSLSAIGGTIAGAVNPNVRTILCNGYARVIYYYLSRFDIPCLIVMGNESADASNSVGHAWNYVQMDDSKWYLLDATWDDTGEKPSYDYFLIGDRATTTTHFPEPLSSLESIVLEYYNYPMPDVTVHNVDLLLNVGDSFELPTLNINYDDYTSLVYISDFSVLDFRDIRDNDDTSISQLFVDDEGHVFTMIPITMNNQYSGAEFNTRGKYISIILIHQITEEKTTILFTNPIR